VKLKNLKIALAIKSTKFFFFSFAFYFLVLVGFKQAHAVADRAQNTPTLTTKNARASSNLKVGEGKSLHISCDKSIRNLNTNTIECTGNVYVRRPSEILTADYVLIDLKTDDLFAKGNVVYFTGTSVIYGDSVEYNFKTETGVIKEGRIANDKYELLGEYIEKYSDDEFFLQDAEYTTCRDCPASWRLAAKSVDFTVEGYALLGNVYIKVNEAPSLYLPGIVIPVKTQRQSGLLFPRFGTSQLNGFMFMQPLFIALSRSTDATLGYGFYSERGRKITGEFRFVGSDRTHGQLNLYTIKDKKFEPQEYKNRWAYDYSHNLVLPYKIEQKLKLINSSDRDYARFFPEDIAGFGEPALVSDAGLSRTSRDLSIWADAKLIRTNLTQKKVGFDTSTVQSLPSVSLATVDHRLTKDIPLHFGISSQYQRFWRNDTSFDRVDLSLPSSQFVPGVTPIRRAERFTLVPEIYYTTRLFDSIEFMPQIQYRNYFYKFDNNVAPVTRRGYLYTSVDLATTFEKVYSDYNFKHKVRPSLTYNLIPYVNRDVNHPFEKQLLNNGYQFDDNDIIPLTNDTQLYFTPLGNSLSYKLSNKIVTKTQNLNSTYYSNSVQLDTGQSFNIYEYRKEPKDRRPFSRLFNILSVSTNRVQANAEHYFYPYINGSTYNLSFEYIFSEYLSRLLRFRRSIGMSYSYNQITGRSNVVGANLKYSINDYFMTTAGASYQLPMYLNNSRIEPVFLSLNGGIIYQSPSQCYRVVITAGKIYGQGWGFTLDIPINLSGSGFNSITSAQSAGSGSGGPLSGSSI
jgi:LPS-assembly protein